MICFFNFLPRLNKNEAVIITIVLMLWIACNNNSPTTPDDQLKGDFYVSMWGNDNNDGQSKETAFRTLKRALQVAKAGNTIAVMAGTYLEEMDMTIKGEFGKPITIIGDKNKPIIDGNRSLNYALWCNHCEHIVMENLIIQNYTALGMNFSYSTDITLRNTIFRDNGFNPQTAADWEIEGYGLDIEGSQQVVLENSEAYRNGPNPQKPDHLMGTGFNIWSCRDCTFRNNRSHSNTGGGLLVEDCINVTVEGNEIYNNNLDASIENWWDGAIWLDGGYNVVIRNNYIHNNLGPGIQISDEDYQHPYGYIVESNTISSNYYGLYIWNFGTCKIPSNILLLRNNTIENNKRKDIWCIY